MNNINYKWEIKGTSLIPLNFTEEYFERINIKQVIESIISHVKLYLQIINKDIPENVELVPIYSNKKFKQFQIKINNENNL